MNNLLVSTLKLFHMVHDIVQAVVRSPKLLLLISGGPHRLPAVDGAGVDGAAEPAAAAAAPVAFPADAAGAFFLRVRSFFFSESIPALLTSASVEQNWGMPSAFTIVEMFLFLFVARTKTVGLLTIAVDTDEEDDAGSSLMGATPRVSTMCTGRCTEKRKNREG
jgi:hypothetical protein